MIKAWFDGACDINPCGNMGYGVIIHEDGNEIYSWSGFTEAHDNNSNNVAEYVALENIIDYLIENNLTSEKILILGDSMLVVNQMSHKWKIKAGRYKDAAIRCITKAAQFSDITINWIPREQNTLADELSKKSMISVK